MNYSQTLDFLFKQLPMFSRVGVAAYKADLNNTIALCNELSNPQNNFKTIHIAGTNGKGSTSHLLAAILQNAGYKVGLYTSPHLKDFRERIKINGQMCSKDFVIDFVQKTMSIIDEIKPSFFELTVAMAFDYFSKEKVDIAVIETGLGGRLDSTNIINPVLSIITNIGYDHVNILGDTLDKIALEKAGIIKQNTPVIIGEYLPETISIFKQKTIEQNAEIIFAQDNSEIEKIDTIDNKLHVTLKRTDEKAKKYILDLIGFYQAKNLRCVIESCAALKKIGFTITDEIIQDAVAKTQFITGFMGRWQIIDTNPTIVLDVAHNEDGIKNVVHQLSKTNYKNLHIIIGMVKDKDIDAVLKLLPKNASYYFTKSQIERALNENILKEKALKFNLIGESFSDVNPALKKAKEIAQKEDLILVCGSVFLVGEVNCNL